jgi:hypothetical protein
MSQKEASTKQAQDHRDRFNHFTHPCVTPQALQGRAIALAGFRVVSLILRNGFVPGRCQPCDGRDYPACDSPGIPDLPAGFLESGRATGGGGAHSRTSASNILWWTSSTPSGRKSPSLAQCVTSGRDPPAMSRNESPVQYPISISLFPISFRSAAVRRPTRSVTGVPWRADSCRPSSN